MSKKGPDSATAEALHQQMLRIKQLEDDLRALEDKHERLRGRFYALRGSPDEPKPKTKAEILRDFGYAPGKPTPHQ